MKHNPHKINGVSYSRWTVWNQCRLRFKLKFIDRLPDPQGEAAARGARIHELAEKYTTTQRPGKLSPELRLYKEELAALRKSAGWAEMMWSFDHDWNLLDEEWPDNVYLRIKTDFTLILPQETVKIIDFKTGRVRDGEYEPQLQLYAAGGAAAFEGVSRIEVELWFLDHHVTTRRAYTLDQARGFQRTWDKRFRPIFTERAFKPNPGNHCRWCPYSKSKGGPCKY